MLKRQVDISESLCLHSLSRINHQNSAVTRCKRTGHFIVEIHMARGVDQVKNILFAVICFVDDPDSLRFDRYTPLLLQIHIIEHLRRHFTARQGSGHLDKTVRQSGLPVIDMGDDTKISDMLLVH